MQIAIFCIYMKINWIILIISFLGLSAFNFITTFDGNNPSVKIRTQITDDTNDSSEIIKFTVEICSAENLESFQIFPKFSEANESADLQYRFASNTKQASVVYYYTVPKNTTQVELSFKFMLEDKAGVHNKIKKIQI